jgi:hypothetical protein
VRSASKEYPENLPRDGVSESFLLLHGELEKADLSLERLRGRSGSAMIEGYYCHGRLSASKLFQGRKKERVNQCKDQKLLSRLVDMEEPPKLRDTGKCVVSGRRVAGFGRWPGWVRLNDLLKDTCHHVIFLAQRCSRVREKLSRTII